MNKNNEQADIFGNAVPAIDTQLKYGLFTAAYAGYRNINFYPLGTGATEKEALEHLKSIAPVPIKDDYRPDFTTERDPYGKNITPIDVTPEQMRELQIQRECRKNYLNRTERTQSWELDISEDVKDGIIAVTKDPLPRGAE